MKKQLRETGMFSSGFKSPPAGTVTKSGALL